MRTLLLALPWIFYSASTLAEPTPAADRLLRPGDPALQTERLQPFEARYRQVVEGETPRAAGERVHRLDVLRGEGRELLRHTVTMLGEGFVEDETVVTRDGLHNWSRRIAAPSILYRVEIWDDNTVQGVNVAKDGSTAETFTAEAAGGRFSAGPSLVLAGMPLRKNGRYLLASFSTDFGVDNADLVSQVVVLERQTIETDAGSFDAWKVALDFFRPNEDGEAPGDSIGLPTQHLWLTDRPPYVVRTEHPSPAGTTVLELVALQAGTSGT